MVRPYLVRCPCLFCKRIYNRFNLWHYLTRPPYWRVVKISGRKFLTVCHHPDKFGDDGHCKSGDIFLVCHVTSPDHMFKGLYVAFWVEAFHGKSSSNQVGGYQSCTSGDINYLTCHLASANHVIKGSCNNPGGYRYSNSRNVFSLSRDLVKPHD